MTIHEAEAVLRPAVLWTPPEHDHDIIVPLEDGFFERMIMGGAAATGDAMTTFLANKMLDHVFSAATYTAPTNTTTALFTAAPSDAGGGTEVTGGSYARVTKTNNATNWPAASGGSKSNGTDNDFGVASANWGLVTHVAIFDGSTNMLMWGALTVARDVKSGDSFKFAATKLVLAFT